MYYMRNTLVPIMKNDLRFWALYAYQVRYKLNHYPSEENPIKLMGNAVPVASHETRDYLKGEYKMARQEVRRIIAIRNKLLQKMRESPIQNSELRIEINTAHVAGAHPSIATLDDIQGWP
jgi:hypothetical protein